MKKSISILTLLLVGISAMGAEGLSQLTLSISTQGPDYYADGTTVQVGEKYLLVYVSKGVEFAGINSDGTLVDPVGNKKVTDAVAVEGAKCGFKAIQYPPTMYPAGGEFIIVLLDTRDAGGAVGNLVSQVGISDTEAAASDSSTKLNAISVAATTDGGGPALVADTQSKAPADTPAPVISKMEGAGENVSLTVDNVSETAVYEVQTTTDLSSGQWNAVVGGARLQVATGDTGFSATVEVPENDKVRFFRVMVPGFN